MTRFHSLDDLQREYRKRQDIYGRNLVQSDDDYMKNLFPDLLRFLSINLQADLILETELLATELLFSLVGFAEEISLLMTCLLKPKKVILVHSARSRLNAYRIESALLYAFNELEDLSRGQVPETEFLLLSELTVSNIVNTFRKRWKELNSQISNIDPEQVAIDVTGGTSVMSISAITAMRELGIQKHYYLDFDSDEISNQPVPGTNRLTSINI